MVFVFVFVVVDDVSNDDEHTTNADETSDSHSRGFLPGNDSFSSFESFRLRLASEISKVELDTKINLMLITLTICNVNLVLYLFISQLKMI